MVVLLIAEENINKYNQGSLNLIRIHNLSSGNLVGSSH